MSEMFRTTTETRIEPCDLCGTPVKATLLIGLYKNTEHWTKEPHKAPCGAPCLGGGIHTEVRLELKKNFEHWTDGVHGWSMNKRETSRHCPNQCKIPRKDY